MNSPSPLIPQGSSLEQQHQARSTLKMKIFCALGVNVVVLLVLLMQGCKREQPQGTEQTPMFSDTNPPPLDLSDTNLPSASIVDTNPPPLLPPVVETTLPPAAAEREYIILKGDTFSSIAPKFGITIKALQTANPTVDPSKLQIGKKIVIPSPAAAAPPAGAVPPMVESGGLYKVKSGDTLSKIATEHHTTVKAIQAANNLTDSRIKVGQQLKLPAKTPMTDAGPVAPVR